MGWLALGGFRALAEQMGACRATDEILPVDSWELFRFARVLGQIASCPGSQRSLEGKAR